MDKAHSVSQASRVNLPELLSRVDNDRELLLDLLTVFKEEFPRLLQTLHRCRGPPGYEANLDGKPHTERNAVEYGDPQGRYRRSAIGAIGARGNENIRTGGIRGIRDGSARTVAGNGDLHGRGVALRILVADDERLSRRLLEKTLERAGYEVMAVENGRLAVEQLNQPDGPRLALLDWVMPELDGPGVCRAVRRQQEQREQSYVYIVLLTSKESKEDIVTGLESGADDYLTKPFDVDELKARLRTGERILHLEGRLVEAREMMRFKATHDALTSIWNRGVIVDLLGRELARSQRESGCTIVLLGDVDHFKSVNDTHGHLVGDEVLKEIARRLLLSIRSYDFVGRYGGEEFLLVLNNCNPQSAEARAEELRKVVSSRPIQTAIGAVQVSMSLGVLLSSDWGVRPAEELLYEVDAALYAAKAAGRNCVRVARPNVSSADVQLATKETLQRLL